MKSESKQKTINQRQRWRAKEQRLLTYASRGKRGAQSARRCHGRQDEELSERDRESLRLKEDRKDEKLGFLSVKEELAFSILFPKMTELPFSGFQSKTFWV